MRRARSNCCKSPIKTTRRAWRAIAKWKLKCKVIKSFYFVVFREQWEPLAEGRTHHLPLLDGSTASNTCADQEVLHSPLPAVLFIDVHESRRPSSAGPPACLLSHARRQLGGAISTLPAVGLNCLPKQFLRQPLRTKSTLQSHLLRT